MKFQVITIFPHLIQGALKEGVVGQSFQHEHLSLSCLNPRDFSTDIHRKVDDRPLGGGDGMVMLPEILNKTLQSRAEKNDRVILLSPQGKKLDEKMVMELSQENCLTLICGRYAGLDQRFINKEVDDEISIGDFVLSGGELAALCLIDAVARKIPGVLGHSQSADLDSFANGQGLEGPLFTRPQVWNEQQVPAILLSGDHKKIAEWRKNIASLVTLFRRPDLQKLNVTEEQNLKFFFEKLSDEDKKVCGLPLLWPKDL
jgi:tRNA (guanine37-N1)-methyltransferase